MIVPSDQFKAQLAQVMKLRKEQNPDHLNDFNFVDENYVRPALENLQRVTDYHRQQLAKQRKLSL